MQLLTVMEEAASCLGFELVGPSTLQDELPVVSFTGREALSELFTFDVLVSSAAGRRELPPDLETSLLGQPASLVLQAEGYPRRVIHGVVAAFALETATRAGGERCMRLKLVPRLWLATHRKRSRIFQDLSVRAIVDSVLDEWQVPRRWDLAETLAPRTYCTQYGETDFDFVARLLAEEGIFFYFEPPSEATRTSAHEPANKVEQLVLSDHALGYPPLCSVDPAEPAKVPPPLYVRSQAQSLVEDSTSVLQLSLHRELRAKSALLTGYDFRAPRLKPRAGAAVGDSNESSGGKRLEVAAGLLPSALQVDAHVAYAKHASVPDKVVVDRTAAKKVLNQERRAAYLGTGRSRNWRLAPGHAFELLGHPVDRVDHDYVVTAVEHQGEVPRTSAGEVKDVYQNCFWCVPAEVAYRPEIPERPPVHVAETAVVEGVGTDDIYTDEHGRIKVRFHWDVGDAERGCSSCWIRVAQGWAGAGFGQLLLPRAGSEVVVTFLHGDPDNPLVTGCVYNAAMHPIFALPSDKSRSGIRTLSTPGGRGYNELSFEDQAGAEEILLHAQRNLSEEVRQDHQVRVGGNQSTSVQGAQTSLIKLGRVDRVLAHDVSDVLLNRVETVGGDHTSVVKGQRVVSVAQRESRIVGAEQTLTVTGGRSLWVSGYLSTQVGSQEKPSEAVTSVFGKETTFATGCARLVSLEKIVLACGDSRLIIGPDAVEIETKKLSLVGADSVELKAKGSVLEMTQEVQLTAPALKLYSQGASVELTNNADINGAQLNLNCGGGSVQSQNAPGQQPKTKVLSLQLHDDNMRPFANKHYRLVVAGAKYEGTTDGNGMLQETIAAEAKVGQVTVWLGQYPEGRRLNWPVEIKTGSLPPAAGVDGALLRLRALGYYTGELTTALTPEAQAALLVFQKDYEVKPTGEVDSATAAKLKEVYGA
jgi:type VI secretion system secreted protein VgrG